MELEVVRLKLAVSGRFGAFFVLILGGFVLFMFEHFSHI
jgi:hypothetical protein